MGPHCCSPWSLSKTLQIRPSHAAPLASSGPLGNIMVLKKSPALTQCPDFHQIVCILSSTLDDS